METRKRSSRQETRKVSFNRLSVSKNGQLETAIRKRSRVDRANFLESFGRDTLYGYTGYEHDQREVDRPVPKQQEMLLKFPTLSDDTATAHLRKNRYYVNGNTASSVPKRTTQKSAKQHIKQEEREGNILSLRGTDYLLESSEQLDIVERLRQQSATRRIKRIIQAENERLERESEKVQQGGRLSFKGVAKGLMTWKVATGVKDILNRRRLITRDCRNLARFRFRRAGKVVILLFHLAKAMAEYSANQAPRTAAQASWHTLRHTDEAKEILFNKTLFMKGKSQYAYVPDRARAIMTKPPMERTESELSQLHSMLKGLQAYDKFTYRIQLAMCRAMTYTRVEHPRIIIRKGHVGIGFYFIFSGSVFVNVEELLVKSGKTSWHTSIILSRGDSFGELALLRKIRRTASVVVRENVELLVVDKEVFAKTCPEIYDKELIDKIKFCRSLKLFEPWSDTALRSICFEAEIQEWKLNKIIVNDSTKETAWVYFCMQSLQVCYHPKKGECHVIKALELNPNKKVFQRKRAMSFVDNFGIIPRVGNRHKAEMDGSEMWKKELEKSFKGMFNFANENKKVDEFGADSVFCGGSDSDEYEDSDEEIEQDLKEKILDAMDLSYANLPHCRGDTDYVEIEESSDSSLSTQANKGRRLSLQEISRRDSQPTFLSLMRRKESKGVLNKDVVFLKIAHLKRGDVFDISEVLNPTGRQMMLVSLGAVMFRIKRTDFFRYATRSCLQHAKKISAKINYPSNTALYQSYNERCAWEAHKTNVMNAALQDITDVCKRHNEFLQHAPVKQSLQQSSFKNETSDTQRRTKLNEYLNFVYGKHKVKPSRPTSEDSMDGSEKLKPTLTRIKSILKLSPDEARTGSPSLKEVSFTPSPTDDEIEKHTEI